MYNKLTDNDKNFGPFTFGYSDISGMSRSFTYNIGGWDSTHTKRPYNNITIHGKRYSLRIKLPVFFKPTWRTTQEFEGCLPLSIAQSREYGVTFGDNFLNIKKGLRKTNGGYPSVSQVFIDYPWAIDTFIGYNHYNEHWELTKKTTNVFLSETVIPKIKLKFLDFDGEEIEAEVNIVERVYTLFSGPLTKLGKLFPKVKYPSLEINFSKETGRQKGSYKGGILGHSTYIAKGESIEDAFKRYCVKHDMSFIGKAVNDV